MRKTYSIIPDCILGNKIPDVSMKMLWIELYSMVNFGEINGLHRGQVMTTYSELSMRTGLTMKQVRTRIEQLVTESRLQRKPTNRGIILTIVDYNKFINGKGRQHKNLTVKESDGYALAERDKGNRGADLGATETHCASELPTENQAQMGRQNEKNEAPYISIREEKDVVVKDDNNSNSSFSDKEIISQKKQEFKTKVIDCLELIGMKRYLEIPDYKDAIVKYLRYYGAVKDDKRLCYETIPNFSIDYTINKWLRNEYSLNKNNTNT